MCEFTPAAEAVVADSAIPKPLREAIRSRRLVAINLHTAMVSEGLTSRVFDLVDRLADLNRALRAREWLPRVEGFDPIALGM